MPLLLKVVYKIKTEGTLPKSLILNIHKNSTKKAYYKPISLMNINANILNEILAN